MTKIIRKSAIIIIIFLFLIILFGGIIKGIQSGIKLYNDRIECENKGGNFYDGFSRCNPNTKCNIDGNMFCKCITGCFMEEEQK